MSRHVIAFEGKPTVLPNIWLAKGCLYMHPLSRAVPVTDGFQWEGPIIGRASDLQRNDETGEVSVEIEWLPGYEKSEDDMKCYDVTFAAKDVVEKQVPATDKQSAYRLIEDAKLIHVAIVPKTMPFHQ